MKDVFNDLKDQGVQRTSMVRQEIGLTTPTGSVLVTVKGLNGKRGHNEHLADLFRRKVCEGMNCVLLGNPPIKCTGMRKPGTFITDMNEWTQERIIGMPSADINAKVKLPENYWKTLAGRIPCKPEPRLYD